MAARPMNRFAIGDRPKNTFGVGDMLWPLHGFRDSCNCVRTLTRCVDDVLEELSWTEIQKAWFRADLRVQLVWFDAQEKRCQLRFSMTNDPADAQPVYTDRLDYNKGQLQAKGRNYRKALKEFATNKLASIGAAEAARSNLVAHEARRQAENALDAVDALRRDVVAVRRTAERAEARVTSLQHDLPSMFRDVAVRLQAKLFPTAEAAAKRALEAAATRAVEVVHRRLGTLSTEAAERAIDIILSIAAGADPLVETVVPPAAASAQMCYVCMEEIPEGGEVGLLCDHLAHALHSECCHGILAAAGQDTGDGFHRLSHHPSCGVCRQHRADGPRFCQFTAGAAAVERAAAERAAAERAAA